MDSIRIRNLRSFTDSVCNEKYVEIKPITVFVGKNSCGKSTLLRTFPLLRQSIESNTTGPILWYGDYVDFGSFKQAINNKNRNGKIYFDFNLKINAKTNDYYVFENYSEAMFYGRETNGTTDINVEVKLGVIESKSISLTDTVTLNIEGSKIKLRFDKRELKSLYLNDEEINISVSNINAFTNRGLFPAIIDRTNNNVSNYFYNRERFLWGQFDKTSELIKQCFHSKTTMNKIQEGLLKVGLCKKSDFVNKLKMVFNRQKYFIDNVEHVINYLEDIVYPRFLLSLIPEVLNKINSNISKNIRNVKYIAPLRATAERYYRHQDLHVNEIDHTGSNLAIFLSRLNKTQLRRFQDWTMQYFGFTVHAGDESLHHEIKIKINDEDEEYNISDMGFGFSQILPIVASIWNEVRDDTRHIQKDRKITFVIEQPELHLHPQFQNMLAKAFANVVKFSFESGLKISILFETHSNVMIDALGEAIEDGVIERSDINIVLFNKVNGETNISFSEFSDEGYLLNWPVGFFSGK
ncbi:TPA: AAA family ATPase [Vibrio cholerae]|nr:AAA family ATPase [Vibrio cholerae]